MKVLLYFEDGDKIPGEMKGTAENARKRVLSIPGVEFVSDPESDYDILHINKISPVSDDIIKQARKKGAAVVYQADSSVIRSLEDSFLPDGVSDKVSRAFSKYLCNLYAKADYILTPTLYGKRLFEKCNAQIEALSYGVDLAAFHRSEAAEKAFREFFNLKENEKTVICSGVRSRKNGIEDFINVAAMLPESKFIWFYSDESAVANLDVKRFLKAASSNVIFAEDVPSEVYQGAFSGSDAFFFPAHECDDDRVILEALASKNTVIVRESLGDIPWLEHGENCFKGKSDTGLAEILQKHLNGVLEDLSEKSYKTAGERSVDKVCERLRQIYDYVYNDAVTKLIRKYSNKNTGKNVLNIGLFSNTFTPDVNGVSVSVATLKTQLERMGHNVYVVTPSMQTKLIGVEFEDGILRIPGLKLNQLYGYRLSRPYSIKARDYIRRMNLDVIHAHTEFSMRILATTAASVLNIPLVTTHHTTYEDYTHYVTGGHFENQSKKIVGWYTKKLLDKKGEIIVPSEKTYNMLKRYGLTAGMHVVPTGIDVKRLSPENADRAFVEDFLEKHDLKDKFRMIYIGRLAPEKGLETILNHMPDIVKQIPNAHLIVVGYGPSFDSQNELVRELGVADHVLFCGKQPPNLIQNFYALGNVFVTASTSETQGITYIEAMAGGLPVIARYDEVLKPVLVHGSTGLFFNNDLDFAEKLYYYYDLPEAEKELMRKNALAKAEEYSLETFGDSIIKVYLKAIKRNSIKVAALSRKYRKEHKLLKKSSVDSEDI